MIFNLSKRAGQWGSYKETMTCYNKEIRKAKRSSWRRNRQEINEIPGSARVMKIMAKPVNNRVSIIKPPDWKGYSERDVQSSLS
jgi:hypothetical protein